MGRGPVLLTKQVSDEHIASLAGLEQRTDRFEPRDARTLASPSFNTFSANDVALIHFRLAQDFTVSKLGIFISPSAGNVDLGIATSDDMATFTKVASTGSVAAGTANEIMEPSLTTPYLCRAGVNYWFMLGVTNATLGVYATGPMSSKIAALMKTSLYKPSAWSSGLPATITGASASSIVPWFVLTA